MSDQVLAFEGAVGYGAQTTGGRGGAVLHVTSLADSGVGTLRWALEQQSGARTIVFDVGGTISLKSQILVQNGNVTIAGQTAPGEGITLEGARMRIKADNVIVRGMHFRPGDGADGQAPGDRDGLMIGTTDFTMKNIIVDHNSFAWAVDENVDINGYVRNVTVSNNIIAEGLSKSIHPKGEHSKGLLVSNWEGTKGDEDRRISIVANLFSDNMQRNPEVRAGQDVEIVNNYIFNYGLGYAGISVGGGSKGTLATSVKVVGNVLAPGISTNGAGSAPINIETMGANSAVAIADNLWTQRGTDAAGNQAQSMLYHGFNGAKITAAISSDGTLGSGLVALDSKDVANYVLGNVGAVNGRGRDAIDTRIVTEVANGKGAMVDTVSQVLSAKAAAVATGAADTDRDGMPDWFEDLYGLQKTVADNNGDNDRDGYTNVEEYINGLISGFDAGKTTLGGKSSGVLGLLTDALAAPREITGFVAGGAAKIDLGGVLGGALAAGGKLGDLVEIAYATGNSYISVQAGATKKLVAVVDNAQVTLADLAGSAATTTDRTTTTGGGNGSGPTTATPSVPAPAVPAYKFLAGTAGNDTHTVKTEFDRVSEKANGGTDLVVSYVSYTLDANVENLSLKGTAALDGTGNELANQMTGNSGANTLDGRAGDDKLYGGDGNDRVLGGLGNDWLQGDGGDDHIWGGSGADTLFGGAGRDSFYFDAGDSIANAAGAQDRIADFGAGDRLVVSGHVVDMSTLAAATIKGAKYADAFAAASKLIDKGTDMALVHGTKDAWLFWDANHDGTIDSGVTLSGVETALAGWMAPPADLLLA